MSLTAEFLRTSSVLLDDIDTDGEWLTEVPARTEPYSPDCWRTGSAGYRKPAISTAASQDTCALERLPTEVAVAQPPLSGGERGRETPHPTASRRAAVALGVPDGDAPVLMKPADKGPPADEPSAGCAAELVHGPLTPANDIVRVVLALAVRVARRVGNPPPAEFLDEMRQRWPDEVAFLDDAGSAR